MADCHEYSKQGEGENARETKKREKRGEKTLVSTVRRDNVSRCGSHAERNFFCSCWTSFDSQHFLSFQINVVARPDMQIAGRSIAAMYISA